ncbi:hypothetical protein D9Q98_010497 [Chlorella vulgaris]|uniref:Reverse transcriptase domain-containing protein n=1 Tax=Chlorella vulgaris TaxID=3077 RepID=A0A9D4TRT2_CHLVU|nr:hypothetical protein D9Q98_010497 [Chlorella vulgaris]
MGITVGHILGKLYALAINTRLNTWLETQGLRARGQAGFRQGYRTVDNCFILRALAERARSRGVKLYLCAVDFEKAFDSVDRPLLWAALQRAGIGGTMLQAIQAMYADVPVCVRTEEGLSGCFQSVLGVKQGCPLSPLLFGIFLDDFEGHIQQLGDAAALPQLAGRTVPPLLFADDMFLLSSSASGLQAQRTTAMRRRAWELGACLVEQQCMLFDVFVKPVLSYGCELWGVDVLLRPDCSSVERVHRWFCRRVQGLPKQVTAAISLAELGRQPLQSFWIQQLVRFWNRLQNSAADEDRVLGWAFKDNLELMREGGDLAAGSACWSRRWLHVLQSAPLPQAPSNGSLSLMRQQSLKGLQLRTFAMNAKKTQVMIMRPGGGSGNGKLAAGESFEYAGLPLEVASSTKYLGLTFSQLSKQHGFASCADVLAKAGRQAMFAMRRRAWELGACLVEQQCMLFDVFVKPVLSYGCELWGVDVLLRPDCSSVERVHRWFCRRVQGLPKQVTAAISLAELGRQPLQSFWIQQLVRFWNRLQNSAADEDRVLGWAFKDNLELMREGGDLAAGSACWSRRWLHVLQSAPPASGTLEWLTELDEAAVIERAAAAYLRKCLEPKTPEQLRRLTEEASRDPLLAATQLHAILYGTAAAVFPPTNAAPRQAAGSTSGQLRRRHQPWFDEECAATRRQIRLQMQASLNSGQPSHLAKEALRIISNRYTRLRKRKAGAWQRQQGSSLLHMQRTDARKFFKQWQREHPKSPIDAATWLRHFVNLQLKRTFQPTASLTATSNPATSHPTAAIPSCSPPTATVCPSSSHPTTAVQPLPTHHQPPTAAISSCSPSAATVPSSSQPTTAPPAINPATCHSNPSPLPALSWTATSPWPTCTLLLIS